MADSIKSPQVAVTTVIKPIAAPTTQVVSKSEWKMNAPPITAAIAPPIKPSQLFLGLILGAILCLPIKTPTKYAKVSLQAINATRAKIRFAPSG